MKSLLARRIATPVWVLVVGAVVLLAVGGAAGRGDQADQASDTTTTGAGAEIFANLTPTSRTTTTAPATTTTTAAPTLDQLKTAFALAFETNRIAIAESLEEDQSLQSVDRFEFDGGPGTVILAVTTGYQTEEIIRTKAWEVTDSMLSLWRGTEFSPGFRLLADRYTYSCSGDFMRRLADRRATRAEWQTSCA